MEGEGCSRGSSCASGRHSHRVELSHSFFIGVGVFRSREGLTGFLLSLAVTFALDASIVSRRNARGRVLFQHGLTWKFNGGRTSDVRAFLLAGRRVRAIITGQLSSVVGILALWSYCNGELVFFIRNVRRRTTRTLLVFVCVVRRGLRVC